MAKSKGGGRQRGQQKPLYAAAKALGITSQPYPAMTSRQNAREIFAENTKGLIEKVPEGYFAVLKNEAKGAVIEMKSAQFITKGGLIYNFADIKKLQNAGINIAVLTVN